MKKHEEVDFNGTSSNLSSRNVGHSLLQSTAAAPLWCACDVRVEREGRSATGTVTAVVTELNFCCGELSMSLTLQLHGSAWPSWIIEEITVLYWSRVTVTKVGLHSASGRGFYFLIFGVANVQIPWWKIKGEEWGMTEREQETSAGLPAAVWLAHLYD